MMKSFNLKQSEKLMFPTSQDLIEENHKLKHEKQSNVILFSKILGFYEYWTCSCARYRVKLSKNGSNNDNSYENKYLVKYYLPLKLSSIPYDSRMTKRSNIISLILILLAIRYLWVARILILYPKYLELWQPKVITGANRTENCALPSDILNDEPEILEQLTKLKFMLGIVGQSTTSCPNIFSFCLMSVVSIMTTMVIGAAYFGIQKYQYRLPSIDFLLDPLRERHDFYTNIHSTVNNILDIHKNTHTTIQYRSSSELFDHDSEDVYKSSTGNSVQSSATPMRNPQKGPKFGLRHYQDDRASFKRLAQEMKVWKNIHPIHLTYDIYAICLTGAWIAMGCLFFFVTSIFFFNWFFIHQTDYKLKTRDRVEYIKCKRWNSSSVLIYDQFQLDPIELDPITSKADITEQQIQDAAAFIELSQFRCIRFIFGHTSYVYFWFQLCAMLNMNLWYIVVTLLHQYFWLSQVIKRFDICLNLMDRYHYVTKNIDRLENRSSNTTNLETLKIDILNTLTIVYVDWNIYRAQLRQFRIILGLAGSHLSAIVVGVYFSIYFTLYNKDLDSKWMSVWFYVALPLILFNLYFAVCISLINMVTSMSKRITTLMSKACINSMELTYIMTLWRRQMLSEDEINRFHTINVLGIEFSQTKLITFNSYMLGVVLFIMHSGPATT